MNKEEDMKRILEYHKSIESTPDIAALSAMEEYAKPYIEIADLISRIFFYGDFKAETVNERLLEERLRAVNLWPTTEDEIVERPQITNT